MAKIRPGGRKTARRGAERPPTGKPKLSIVTSGYGRDMIPLSWIRWIRLSKNRAYLIFVAGTTKNGSTDQLIGSVGLGVQAVSCETPELLYIIV